jgi:hypothetical protein
MTLSRRISTLLSSRIFVFPFYPSFWPQEISIRVLDGFSWLKKFLDCGKNVFWAPRNFLNSKNPFFQRLEISSTEKNCLTGFAKFLEAVYTVFPASRKLLNGFCRSPLRIRIRSIEKIGSLLYKFDLVCLLSCLRFVKLFQGVA